MFMAVPNHETDYHSSYIVGFVLLAHGQWFSPGTPASSTTKIGRHDIAEILLKVELKHQKSKFFFDLCILVRSVRIALTDLTLPHVYGCPKP
jgi:hypothetical protein